MNLRKCRAAALAIVLWFWPSQIMQGQSSEPLAVIVNRDNPVDNLSQAELRRVFLGERKFWKGSQKIIVLMPKDGSPERESTLRLLHMNELDYKKHWLGKVNAGDADGIPISLPANGTAISLVSDSSTAVAIIPLSAVRGSVKIMKIDNRAPSDTAYSWR
jgi:ABC-type phosphate transport system substrate-binding protein